MGCGHRTGVFPTVPLCEGVDGQLSRVSPLKWPSVLVPLVLQGEVVGVVCQHPQGHRVAVTDWALRVQVYAKLEGICSGCGLLCEYSCCVVVSVYTNQP